MNIHYDPEELTALAAALAPQLAEALRPLLIPPANTKTEKEFFTVRTLAEYLSVKRSTVYGWVHQNKVPYLKDGNFLRFRKAEIDSWRLAHSIRPE